MVATPREALGEHERTLHQRLDDADDDALRAEPVGAYQRRRLVNEAVHERADERDAVADGVVDAEQDVEVADAGRRRILADEHDRLPGGLLVRQTRRDDLADEDLPLQLVGRQRHLVDEDVVVDVEVLLLLPHVAPDDFRRVLRQLRVVLDAVGVARFDESLEEDGT